jgi:hypothetical protein
MAEQNSELLFDKRLVTLNTRLNNLDTKTLDAHLKKLPDLQAQSEEWPMFVEETDGSEPTFAAIEEK